ncbi:MAG: SpoIIE family protein phosphatase [Anaerolineae bacterium]|nr:SpoIIE family protein phosphatase [Anaerolineae bacterium]
MTNDLSVRRLASPPATPMRLGLTARLYQVFIGGLGLGLLLLLTARFGLTGHYLILAVFLVLSTLIKRAGFRIVPEATHSLVGIADIAAILLFGPVTGAWVAALSEAAYLGAHAFRRFPFHPTTHLGTPLFNAGLKSLMALISGELFLRLGGVIPPQSVELGQVIPMSALFLSWFLLDHLGWFVRVALAEGGDAAWTFLRRVWFWSITVELLPLPFAPLMAAVLTRLGATEFAILAGTLIALSLIVHRQATTRQELNERVAELITFEELGQAIVSAQMDLKRLGDLAYEYATRVATSADFRLVLVDPEKNALRPVLWVEDGERRPADKMPLDGLNEWLRDAREAQLVTDTQQQPGQPELALMNGTRSWLAVPLLAGRDIIGGMLLESETPHAFTLDQLRLLSTLGSQLAVGVENARLYEREWKRAIQLSAISEVSRQVAAIINLDELFNRVVQLVQASFGYDFVQILTVQEDSVIFRASTGFLNEARRIRGYTIAKGHGIIGWVASHGEPLLANDVAHEPRYSPDPEAVLRSTRSELSVPLKVETRVLGVLDVQSNRLNAFDKDDLFVLQTLADQIAVAIEEARLYQETLARQRLEQELALAAEIQSSLLPESPPDIPGWAVAAFWRPALEMAGDFYDFLTLTEGRYGFVIADVSDKGIPAAIFMAVARSSIRASVLGRRAPAEALERANTLLLKDTRTDMFVTLCYCILDPSRGALVYVNAGHTPPLMYRPATDQAEYLTSHGIVLGAIEPIHLEEQCTEMEPGDVLVLYTDGVTEAINMAEEDFGEERLAQVVRQAHHQSPADIINSIISAVTAHAGDMEQFDDFALVVIKREITPQEK